MTDQELLELAAKAAGIEIHPSIEGKDCLAIVDKSGYWGDEHKYWNPLTDDGDAFRLAVNLRMIIDPYTGLIAIPPNIIIATINTNGIGAATRRAIVQVAAEIGKGQG